jgi:hypothetical protein
MTSWWLKAMVLLSLVMGLIKSRRERRRSPSSDDQLARAVVGMSHVRARHT